MSKRIATALMTLSVAVWAAACAEAPTDRADAAKARVEAVGAEAAVYAPEAYAAAQEAVSRLDAEMAAQAQGFALFRSYSTTDELIASVEAAADSVESAIEAGKERLDTETGRLAGEVRQAVDAARESLDGMPRAALPAERAAEWRADLDAADASIEEAERLRQDNQLVEAQQVLERARERASGVSASVASLEAERTAAAEEAATRMAQGDVTLPRTVMADGKPIPAGTYRLRLADEAPAGEAAMRPGRWVEFVGNGTVAGRSLAVVIPDAEIREVAASSWPRNEAWVAELQGGEYVRVWLNRGGVHYLMHLPRS